MLRLVQPRTTRAREFERVTASRAATFSSAALPHNFLIPAFCGTGEMRAPGRARIIQVSSNARTTAEKGTYDEIAHKSVELTGPRDQRICRDPSYGGRGGDGFFFRPKLSVR